jgi:hypothetical protein
MLDSVLHYMHAGNGMPAGSQWVVSESWAAAKECEKVALVSLATVP